MSKYTDYDTQSKVYDKRRIPLGTDIYLGQLLLKLGCPLASMRIVDLGCGTGSYAEEFLEKGVGKVVCTDASEGMLAKAKEKLARFGKDRVESIFQHTLPSFPPVLQEGSFDGAMLNLVLHHIESIRYDKHDHSAGTGLISDYRNHLETFKTANKLLKPGGLIMICTVSRYQFDSLFYMKHFGDIINYFHKLFPPIEMVEKMLDEAGFGDTTQIALPNKFLTADKNFAFDPRGPFDPAWRDVGSVWAALTDSELKAVLERISNDEKTGKLDKLIAESKVKSHAAGALTFLLAQKN